jgi:hypothetical protein
LADALELAELRCAAAVPEPRLCEKLPLLADPWRE